MKTIVFLNSTSSSWQILQDDIYTNREYEAPGSSKYLHETFEVTKFKVI